jgi:small subunit ribosomal protein S16
MLVIRLQRTGRENLPTYRVVLSEKSQHVKKGAKEIFGHYLPSRETPVFECNQDRIAHWVKMGAIPSDTVARLLRKAGMKGMDKFVQKYAKQKSKNPEEVAAAPAAAPAPKAEAPAAEAPKAEEPKADAPAA